MKRNEVNDGKEGNQGGNAINQGRNARNQDGNAGNGSGNAKKTGNAGNQGGNPGNQGDSLWESSYLLLGLNTGARGEHFSIQFLLAAARLIVTRILPCLRSG